MAANRSNKHKKTKTTNHKTTQKIKTQRKKNKTTPHSINLHILRNQCKMDLKFSLFGVSECSIFFCLGCFIFLYNCFEALKKRSSFCLRPCKKTCVDFDDFLKPLQILDFFFDGCAERAAPDPAPPQKMVKKTTLFQNAIG